MMKTWMPINPQQRSTPALDQAVLVTHEGVFLRSISNIFYNNRHMRQCRLEIIPLDGAAPEILLNENVDFYRDGEMNKAMERIDALIEERVPEVITGIRL